MQRTLERSLALFGVDGQGLHLSGHLFEMDRYLTWYSNPPARGAGASKYLGSIADDIWNIATLVERLEWMRIEARTNGHLADRWSRYAATDIQGIHVDLRSVLDYVAALAGQVFLAAGQAPTSFRKLLEWVDKNPSRVLPELRQLLTLQKHWFWAMRAVRDSLVHGGARTLVFGKPEEGILFQVYGKHFNQVSEPALMWNKNVAHFDRYVAMVLAHLLCFLDDFGALVKKSVSAADVQPGFWARSYHPGFVVIQEWMLELLAQVRAPTE